jgi:hypothetical protein
MQELIKELEERYGKPITKFHKRNWNNISKYQILSEDFIRKFKNKVNWEYISQYQKFSKDFIREFQDKVNWSMISTYQKFSEDFIREFQDKVNWRRVSKCQKFSEDFIREFQHKVDWRRVSIYQKLSEDFIREFQHKVDWRRISIFQKISEDFIREFKNKVDWRYISKYQKLSEDFISEFQDEIFLDVKSLSWLYKDKEFLKQQVIDCQLYECYDEYFIAYKGIRSDRYSNYNFQYQYLKGETYENNCDCTENEFSFGLSVWTEKKARDYCNELVVKVKVNYEDVGRIVHSNGKIRCRKITILE